VNAQNSVNGRAELDDGQDATKLFGNMAIDITGKWALVTGSRGGIGSVIARELARLGANLVLHARRPSDVSDLADRLRKTGPRPIQIECVSADLTEEEDIDRMVEQALTLSGGIDILYNNAAITSPPCQPYWTVPSEEYRRCFQVNFLAPVRITSGLLPRMLERKFGRIVQVSSGIRDQPELMAYAASKAALDKYVRDTAVRLRGTGVLMNLLDPGWIRTNLGGPNAPNSTESVVPGALVPTLLDGEVHGTWFSAQDFATVAT
jgi:NAD(P)-dependent dehydrogenase (short-subunit alcohol dehydrogenase family)